MSLRSFKVRYAGLTVFFGDKALNEFMDVIRGGGYEVVAIVTGKSSARVSGALRDIEELLKDSGMSYSVIPKVSPNPTTDQCDEVAEALWREGAEAVIAIGGGSVIDTAKVAAAAAASGGSCEDYIRLRRRVRKVLPVYAVNLTHGTGSEVDRYAVLTVKGTPEKRGASITYPRAGLDNPRYTLTLPKNQTIYTALDALYHAYESSTSRELTSPYVVMLSAEAAAKISEWLGKVVSNPGDLTGRYWLLYASLIAGIAIDHAVTHLIHGIEHALSGVRPKLPHGAGLAIIGPRIVRDTHKAMPEESAAILNALGFRVRSSPEDAVKAEEAIKSFQERVGFKERLSDYGIGMDDVRDIVKLVTGPLKYLWDSTTPFKVTEEYVKEVITQSI